jgi:hypothetical protein
MSAKRTLFVLGSGILLAASACNPARERDEEAAATGGVGTVGDTAYPPPPGQIGAPGTATAGDTLGAGQPRRP